MHLVAASPPRQSVVVRCAACSSQTTFVSPLVLTTLRLFPGGTRSMHKRGYRDAMHAASLKENVAAGLLLASGWNPETQALADPMCGSGTLVIEAALIALRRAPG